MNVSLSTLKGAEIGQGAALSGMMRQLDGSYGVALKSAYQLLEGSVTVRGTILSYMDIFLYVGCMFLICVTFVLVFIKKAKTKVSMAHATH